MAHQKNVYDGLHAAGEPEVVTICRSSWAGSQRYGASPAAHDIASSRRPLAVRWRYSFIRTYKPVLDDAEYRSFDSMEEYRQWCERELPD